MMVMMIAVSSMEQFRNQDVSRPGVLLLSEV